jgi:pimeloyl-ACP methyl ester carboxylesterase
VVTIPDPPPGRSLRLAVDGLTLHVLDHGATSEAAAARPLLLLHGGMGHARWWDLVAPALADVAHPFALDRRGHGDSEWAEPGQYGWERDLLDVEDVMRRLCPLPWSVAGHSQGGLLAVHLATRRNVAIRELILLDVPLEPQSPSLQRAGRAFQRIPQLRYPSLEQAMLRFQPFPPVHQVAPDVLAYLARHSFKPIDDGMLTSKFHWKSYQRDRSREGNPLAEHGARLRALDVPVLSVRGGESTILTRDDQQELLRRLRFGRGVEIAGATHSLHAERPAEVAAAMREFLLRDA